MDRVRVEQREAQPVACVHQPAPAQLVDQIGKAIREVMSYLARNAIEPAGAPYGRSTWEPGDDLEIGVPVTKGIEGDGRVVAGELPACKAAVARHVGPHEKISETTAELRKWIAERGLAEADVPWEIYLTNPSEVPDPNAWENELVHPVE
ncbi:MAG: GyrI-like domain-containing protein [Pseudomonadales bacterium]